MRAFRRIRGQTACEFEPAEVDLLEGMLGQLIELLLDGHPGADGPGTQRLAGTDEEDDDIFVRLQREMSADDGDHLDDELILDPVLKRLFPDAYPHDPEASRDFRRFTHHAQLDDKVISARTMLSDLRASRGGGRCAVPDPNTTAWLKSLTNIRIALSVRLDIQDADDAEYVAELPEEDPRSWIHSIYEWLGWVQESLLMAHE